MYSSDFTISNIFTDTVYESLPRKHALFMYIIEDHSHIALRMEMTEVSEISYLRLLATLLCSNIR